MEISRTTMKRIMVLIAFAALLLIGLQRMDAVMGTAGFIWGVLSPLFAGAALAFILNVPMSFLERKLFPKRAVGKGKKGAPPALARGISLLLTFVLLSLIHI